MSPAAHAVLPELASAVRAATAAGIFLVVWESNSPTFLPVGPCPIRRARLRLYPRVRPLGY